MQEEIYLSFFDDLRVKPEQALGASEDAITGDVIYGGDIQKWKKLANSLRMRFCYAYFQCGSGRARQEFEAALARGGYFLGADGEALIQIYGCNSSALARKRIPITVAMRCHSCCLVMTKPK